MRTKLAIALCLALSACGGSDNGPPGPWPDTLTVEHPVSLPATLPALKVQLGEVGESKPNVVLLPDGEVLLVDYSGGTDARGYTEHLNIYRSEDNAQTWGSRVTVPLGREGYFSLTRSGVLFLTAQVLGSDYRNTHGYPYFVVYRSADGGRTWNDGTPVLHTDVGGQYATEAARTVLELPDDSLLWLVGSDYTGNQFAWRSYDAGLTWAKSGAPQAPPAGFDPVPTYGQWSGEAVMTMDGGDVIDFVRCFPGALPAIPGDPLPADSDVNDEANRLTVFRSHDGGETWALDTGAFPVRYGEMYGSQYGDVVFTFTVRALAPVVGVRVATRGRSDLTHDVVEISAIQNDGAEDPAGGGYGNSIKLPDGAWLTPYSYRDPGTTDYHVVAVRWAMQ